MSNTTNLNLTKLTGNESLKNYPTVQANNADIIDSAISQIHGLPTVDSTDNGKILQVVNGEWAAATLPNASGVSF